MTEAERQSVILSLTSLLKSRVRYWSRRFARYDPEEMESEGYLALIRAVDHYQGVGGASLATYAARLIDGRILHFLRRQWRDRSLCQPPEVLERFAALSTDWRRSLEARLYLEGLVEQLRPKERYVIEHHWLREESQSDVARQMGITVQSMRYWLLRAMSRLQRLATEREIRS